MNQTSRLNESDDLVYLLYVQTADLAYLAQIIAIDWHTKMNQVEKLSGAPVVAEDTSKRPLVRIHLRLDVVIFEH